MLERIEELVECQEACSKSDYGNLALPVQHFHTTFCRTAFNCTAFPCTAFSCTALFGSSLSCTAFSSTAFPVHFAVQGNAYNNMLNNTQH